MKIEKQLRNNRKVKIIWLDLDDYKRCGMYPPEILRDRVLEVLGTTRKRVFNGRRHVSVILTKFIIIYFLRKYCINMSLADIGRFTANPGSENLKQIHCNAFNALRKIEAWIETDEALRDRVEMIDKML